MSSKPSLTLGGSSMPVWMPVTRRPVPGERPGGGVVLLLKRVHFMRS